MKRVVSLLMNIVIIVSMFTMLGTVASAQGDPKNVMYVSRTNFKNGQATFNVYLKKNVSLVGAIIKVVYDPNVVEPITVGDGSHSASSGKGLFVAGEVDGTKNAYSMAFVSSDSYKVGSSDKGLFTVKFKVKDSSYPKTAIKFYCVEFNTTNSSQKIDKNNGILFSTINTATLDQLTYTGISRVSNGLKLTWKATPGAKGYNVYKASGGEWVKIATTKNLYYTDTAARANVVEKYAVRAYNAAGGDSGYTSRSGKYTLSEPTVKVSGVYGGVKITWNKINKATTYRIYRKYNGESRWTVIANVGSGTTSYIDKNAKSARNIFYTVRAGANSAYSTYDDVKISYIAVPKVSSVANTSTGVYVKWGAISGAQKYVVYRKTSGSSWTSVGSTTGTSFIDRTAKSGVTYTYTVRAYRGSNKSNYESGKSIKCLSVPNLTSIRNTFSGVTVKWDKVSGANSYKVFRKTSGQSGWKVVGYVTTNQYTDKNTTKGKTYTYTVRAATGTKGNGTLSGYESPGLSIKK